MQALTDFLLAKAKSEESYLQLPFHFFSLTLCDIAANSDTMNLPQAH